MYERGKEREREREQEREWEREGRLQLLHLRGNCQLTLTKEGISALAAAFKERVIR